MASDFKYHNMKILEQGLESYLKKVAAPRVAKGLKKVAEQLIDEVWEGKYNVPVYTGHLKNSIGAIVMKGSKTLYLSPAHTELALNQPQSVGKAASGEYGMEIWGIVGAEYFQKAVTYERQQFPPDSYTLVVFASVPYAAYVNEYGGAQKGHHWGNPETATGGYGIRFYNNIVGWSLWSKLGREFFKGNKPYIDDTFQVTQ